MKIPKVAELQFHIMQETLDTEEASYLWHFSKRVSEMPLRLKEIDRYPDIIRKQGRHGFLAAPPENFSRLLHDYSDDQKGFILWKDMLGEDWFNCKGTCSNIFYIHVQKNGVLAAN